MKEKLTLLESGIRRNQFENSASLDSWVYCALKLPRNLHNNPCYAEGLVTSILQLGPPSPSGEADCPRLAAQSFPHLHVMLPPQAWGQQPTLKLYLMGFYSPVPDRAPGIWTKPKNDLKSAKLYELWTKFRHHFIDLWTILGAITLSPAHPWRPNRNPETRLPDKAALMALHEGICSPLNSGVHNVCRINGPINPLHLVSALFQCWAAI